MLYSNLLQFRSLRSIDQVFKIRIENPVCTKSIVPLNVKSKEYRACLSCEKKKDLIKLNRLWDHGNVPPQLQAIHYLELSKSIAAREQFVSAASPT